MCGAAAKYGGGKFFMHFWSILNQDIPLIPTSLSPRSSLPPRIVSGPGKCVTAKQVKDTLENKDAAEG